MLWAVLMAGGTGTRFWPESREHLPKQFLSLLGKETLIEQTCSRLKPLIPSSQVLVVTQHNKQKLVQKLLKDLKPWQIVGEPVGRNTAPCAVLAARLALEKDPQAVIALLPADHLIRNEPVFRRALKAGNAMAVKTGLPVTFGIRPASAHTGYGYLEMGAQEAHKGGFDFYRLKGFHEKPKPAKAKRYFSSGRFLWNSGMFIWKASALLEAAEKYLPESTALADDIMAAGLQKGLARFYAKMPNISIDYALMEPLKGHILTCPVDFGWSDVGSWESLREVHSSDKDGNITVGESLFLDSRDNIVKHRGKMVVLLGMQGHLVVDTPDALLVCPAEKTQEIRQIVQELKNRKLHRYL
ncbi:MAG: mannose-1-phosphate guanylyltransferase [Candidatus Omnitrophica bacterium]|nr:mannose-1-phosphate guanylyltransferase [Candidatus Omnitrophota bacterium]